jgi:hypothetical protein
VLAANADELRGKVFDPAEQKEAGRRIFKKLEAGLRTGFVLIDITTSTPRCARKSRQCLKSTAKSISAVQAI